MDALKLINDCIDRKADLLTDANDRIWSYAELAFHEYKSSELLIDILREEGFTVESGLAGIPTCFSGTFSSGCGEPVVGILGEFDALPGLSQEAGCSTKCELVPGGAGHGCGHSALGTGALGAAIAVKEYLRETGKDGTIIYFGCPAEEGAGSKQFMAMAGVFDEVDFVYTWHPDNVNGVDNTHNNAIMGAVFTFNGISSHAGATPYLGRSALDAAELMSVGCNYLREHIIPEARLNYAYLDAGGTAANVVQDHSVVRYEVRAPYVHQLRDLFARVTDVARGAALMTGTEVDYEIEMAFTEYLPNRALAPVAYEAMLEVGPPDWDDEDYALAKEFLDSYDEETKRAIRERLSETYGADRLDEILSRPLDHEIHPYEPERTVQVAGSTDVGDVGLAVPTLNLRVATCCVGNVGHSWQMTAQTGSRLAHKGLLAAARMLALSSIRTMERPDVIEAAKAEVRRRNGGHYTSPLPAGTKPPIDA